MTADALWVESYKGEVLGETLFRLLAERESDPERRAQFEVLTLLERSTKELAEPVLALRGIDCGDTEVTVAEATTMADFAASMSRDDFLNSVEPVTTQFLAKYRQLVELSSDPTERAIAEAYVAHEEALAAFARRELGREPGDSLAPILALPHVAAASKSV